MAPPAHSDSLSLLLIVLLVSLVLVPAVSAAPFIETNGPDTGKPYTITLFIPASNSIPTTQIMDLINEFNASGNVLIATSRGLSLFNQQGEWSTRHVTYVNVSEGLLDDFITSIEYDSNGRLWIGYSEGIQIYNGKYYQTIRDQQMMKSLRINDIQRWNSEMWVAAGNAGLHRYRDGAWTWFQPFSEGGPGFYEATGMVWDHGTNTTIIATEREGVWIIRSQDDPVQFECIASKDSRYGLLDNLKRDYSGGVYFFNDTTVAHYSPEGGFTPVLTSRDLAITSPPINDLTSGPDGKLYLATDNGIFIWENGGVYRNLDRFQGIGTSSIVDFITIDKQNRIWFSTPDNVGFYIDHSISSTPIEFQVEITPAVTATTLPEARNTVTTTRPVPTLREEAGGSGSSPDEGGNGTIIDSLIRSIRSFFMGIGLKPRF